METMAPDWHAFGGFEAGAAAPEVAGADLHEAAPALRIGPHQAGREIGVDPKVLAKIAIVIHWVLP